MGKYIFIGASAGLTSALLYAAIVSGSPLAALLFYTAPLPVLLAGLAWGSFVAVIAVVAGSLALAVLVSSSAALFFFLLSAAPSAYIGRLALLSRPRPGTAGSELEWYPIGRIVVWAAAFGGLAAIATIPMFGFDVEAYRDGLATTLKAMMQPEGAETVVPEGIDIDRLATFFAEVLPVFGAALWMLTELVNLWAAGRIVRASTRLRRPWPFLSRIDYPPYVPVVFVVAVAGSFLGGLVGFVASVFAATFGLAYVLLGLAVLHEVTRGNPSRPFILGLTYLLLVVFSWIALALAALGLGEAFVRLRDRRSSGGSPS